jgi:SAM-dependent methyltransferase
VTVEAKTPEEFLRGRQTAHPFELNPRLGIFGRAYREHRDRLGRPLRVLDVGCGLEPALLRFKAEGDTFHGCDFYADRPPGLDEYTQLDLNRDSLSAAVGTGAFDVVFCGEVIEHVFSPDALLREIKAVMTPDAILVLSTPNLGYWLNRLLLLAGVSPLFLENSAEKKLGRFTRRLGQGNPTEGHIRLFTYRALRELVEGLGFEIVRVTPTYVWRFPPDLVISRLSRSLAATNVFVLRRG